MEIKKTANLAVFFFTFREKRLVFSFLYDGFERLRLIHSEVSEHLAVDFDTCFLQRAHQLAVAQSFETSGSVDTLNPQCAEITLFVLAIAISILETFLPSVLGNCPYVGTATKIASCEAHDLLTTVTRSDVIY